MPSLFSIMFDILPITEIIGNKLPLSFYRTTAFPFLTDQIIREIWSNTNKTSIYFPYKSVVKKIWFKSCWCNSCPSWSPIWINSIFWYSMFWHHIFYTVVMWLKNNRNISWKCILSVLSQNIRVLLIKNNSLTFIPGMVPKQKGEVEKERKGLGKRKSKLPPRRSKWVQRSTCWTTWPGISNVSRAVLV